MSDLGAHKDWKSGKGKGFKNWKFLEKKGKGKGNGRRFLTNLTNTLGLGWEREM